MRLLILASGSGTTFEYLVEENKKRIERPLEFVGVVTDNPEAAVIQKANVHQIPVHILNPKDFSSPVEWDEKLTSLAKILNPEWICLAGFLKKIGPSMLAHFPNRIVNTHPSLLPKYGGKGMYGRKVHEAVFDAGDDETGITIHAVNEEFDAGPILAQKTIDCSGAQSASDIENLVKGIEKKFLFEFLAGSRKPKNLH